ncbi:hypothetical protein RB195_022879 [Necator americanus]|uniref:Uncharacterized protein n=1 Tax=Necator americanus TaxID=51031 RepID=A0ABR1EGX4_NECAM
MLKRTERGGVVFRRIVFQPQARLCLQMISNHHNDSAAFPPQPQQYEHLRPHVVCGDTFDKMVCAPHKMKTIAVNAAAKFACVMGDLEEINSQR